MKRKALALLLCLTALLFTACGGGTQNGTQEEGQQVEQQAEQQEPEQESESVAKPEQEEED